MVQTFNVILCGRGNVGKTTFVDRLRTGEFLRDHVSTPHNTNRTLEFNTNHGLIRFIVTEQRDVDTTVQFDAAMVMYSMCDPDSFAPVRHNTQQLTSVINDQFIVIVGNKADKIEKFRAQYNGVGIKKYTVSARTNYHAEKPWLYLARKLTRDEDLFFVAYDPIEPPTIDLPVNQEPVLRHGKVTCIFNP